MGYGVGWLLCPFHYRLLHYLSCYGEHFVHKVHCVKASVHCCEFPTFLPTSPASCYPFLTMLFYVIVEGVVEDVYPLD